VTVSASVLFVDPQSPYAYLAHERAGRVLGGPVEVRPIALGPIFRWRGWGPTVRVGDELFFGDDHLEAAATAHRGSGTA